MESLIYYYKLNIIEIIIKLRNRKFLVFKRFFLRFCGLVRVFLEKTMRIVVEYGICFRDLILYSCGSWVNSLYIVVVFVFCVGFEVSRVGCLG